MILAALPAEEYRLLCPYLRFVPLKSGSILWEPNKPIQSVYFPGSGMVSLVVDMIDGARVEVGMTGREGFVGTPILLGVQDTPVRAIVQIEGAAFCVDSDLLRHILPQTPRLEGMLRRYTHALAMQVAQAAACNCRHQVRTPLALARDGPRSHRVRPPTPDP